MTELIKIRVKAVRKSDKTDRKICQYRDKGTKLNETVNELIENKRKQFENRTKLIERGTELIEVD